MKKILILGGSILQVPAIIKSKELGLHTIVIDQDSNAIGKSICDEFFAISTLDKEKTLKLAKSKKIDAILTIASDLPLKTVAYVGEKLKLSTLNQNVSEIVTNKYLMREKLSEKGIPCPTYFVTSNLKEYTEIVKMIALPFIVKPCDSSGSRGVTKVDLFSDAEKAFHHAMNHSKVSSIIIEEFLEGPEVSVESLTMDNDTDILAITDKVTTGAPYFTEMGHSIPTMLSKEIQEDIKSITKNAIEALNINNSPSHTEIIITKEGPKIVEVGARMGGDNITSHLVPMATGYDMMKHVIRLSLGEKYDLEPSINSSAAIRYLKLNTNTFNGFKNLDGLISLHKPSDIKITHSLGSTINEIKSSNDRLGYVIYQADSVEKAIKKCELLITALNEKLILEKRDMNEDMDCI